MLIEWDDEKLSVGIKLLDEQHKVLVSYINELHDLITNDASESAISELFEKLYKYTQYHFHDEEKYFSRLYKDDLTLHNLQHKHFLEELAQIQQDSSKQNISEELLFFLTDWLVNHIVAEDLKYIKKHQDNL